MLRLIPSHLSKISRVRRGLTLPIRSFTSSSPLYSTPDAATTSESATVIAEKVAEVPVLTNHPTDLVCWLLDNVHTFFDIPYWGAIVGTTIVIRTMMIPLAIKQASNAQRMKAINPDLKKLQALAHQNPSEQQRYYSEIQQLFKHYDINPTRMFMTPLVQAPIFISFFFALKKMGDYFPQFAQGGYGWFLDLTATDPTYILPALNALSFLAILQVGGEDLDKNPQLKFFLRCISVISIPAVAYMPQGVFLYWLTNNTFSIIQTIALKNPIVAEKVGITLPLALQQSPAMMDKYNHIQSANADSAGGNNLMQRLQKVIAEASGAAQSPEILDKQGKVISKGIPLVVPTPPPVLYSEPPNQRKQTVDTSSATTVSSVSTVSTSAVSGTPTTSAATNTSPSSPSSTKSNPFRPSSSKGHYTSKYANKKK